MQLLLLLSILSKDWVVQKDKPVLCPVFADPVTFVTGFWKNDPH